MKLHQALFSVLLFFAACDAIGVVGTDSIQTFGSSTTSKTVVAAQTPLAGDVMVLGGIFGAATTPNGPSGFTLACSNPTSGGYLWYHVAGSGENPNYGTMTWSGASGGTLFLGERSGMNTSNPFTTGSPCTMATPAGSVLSPSVSLGLPSYSGSVGEGLFETATLNRCTGGVGTCNQSGWTEQAYRNNTVFGEEQYESATAPPGGTSAQINFNTAAPTIVHALGWYDNPAGQAVTTLRYMLGIDFVCGSGPNGSLANPGGNITSTMAANALAALYHTNPLIVVNENPWQNQPYSVGHGIECTPPSSLFTGPITYLIRFTTYNPDFLYQSSQTMPTPWLAPFVAVQYDNETSTIPQTNPNENAVPGGDNSVPGWYYWAFPQQLEATYPSDNFQSTAGISQSDSGQLSVLYGTSPYWVTNVPGMWDAQSQTGGASLSSWQNVWEPQLAKIMAYNTNLQIFLGVGQVLTGGTEATQGQIDTLLENVPPNFAGVWLNCSAQGSVPNGYDRCAQGIADSAGIVDATPYPIPVSTSPPPSPPPSPAATPTPQPNATALCIGQIDGTGLVYNLVSDDEFNQDLALNTASPVPSDLNISDNYPAASPPAISTGNQTTWSNQYSFGRSNGGLAGVDDSKYPSFAQIATWQAEYGAAAYPSTIQLDPGVGVILREYNTGLYHPTLSAAYTVATPTLAANYTAGSTTLIVSSNTGISVGEYASIQCVAQMGCVHQYQYDTNYPKVTAISGTTITLSGTGFATSYIDNPNGGTQTVVFGPSTLTVTSATGLAAGQVVSFSGSNYDNLNPTITAVSGTTVTISPGFGASHPLGQIMSATPADVASQTCFSVAYCLHNLGGLMDGNVNNAYEYGYWVYGTVQVPDGSSNFQGDWPSDWTLCESGGCGPANNDYYEMDTFEVFSTIFGAGIGRQTLQGEAAGGEAPNPGPTSPALAQYYTFNDSTIAMVPGTWSEVSTPTNVWLMHNNQPQTLFPLNQVPAANNPSFPGVSPIMVQQSCWWGSYCAPGVNPTASPLVMIEQYYRHYAPSTTVCGPPFGVPPPPSPTPVPTAPPTAPPAVAPSISAQSASDCNSSGSSGSLTCGLSGGANSTSGQMLLGIVNGSPGNSFAKPSTNWTALIDAGTSTLGIYYCVVGSGGGQCPVANSWSFNYPVGATNSGGFGGLVHIYEFTRAGTPWVVSPLSYNAYYTSSTGTPSVPLTIPSQNGLTLVIEGSFNPGTTTPTLTSIVDSLTGALTTNTLESNLNVATGNGNNSQGNLQVENILQDAYLANSQPIMNNPLYTFSGNGGNASAYLVFIPAATATAPPCIPASLLHGMVGC